MVGVENQSASLAGETQPSANIEKIHVTLTRYTASFVGEDMNKRKIQNSELDAIGAKLIKAGRLSVDELDRIVSAPKLFDGVRERIATQERQQVAQPGWLVWKPVAASMAAVGALAISLGYFGYFSGSETAPISRSNKLPAVYQVAADETKQEFKNPVPFSAPASIQVTRPTITKIVYREKAKPVQPKRRPAAVKPEREFYPINLAGNVEDTLPGGHVVRVDMPRSSLFAMGVDLPLENDSKFIKTDVLVGSDGVPRGIRFVE
jgi:hypothetical protein